jgi:hypothetical protein
MKQLNETDALNETIALLRYKQAQELMILQEQFQLTYDSLKPVNIIKNAFSEITHSPDIKGNILNNVIGLTTGYLSKRILLGSTHNPIKRILGSVLQFVVANVVTKKSDSFTSKDSGKEQFL